MQGKTDHPVTQDDSSITPMMAQFLEIKSQVSAAILFYRMGDFYEMFFDDAVQASAALDIALTSRGLHLGQPIPMCGVPVHSADGYLLTLIRKGFRVAIAEQMEDPAEARKRGAKSVVRREVVRLVTPGTLTEESLLEARRHNFLAAFAEIRDDSALAWADISTGEVRVSDCPPVRLGPELARLCPREVLLNEARDAVFGDLVTDIGAAVTTLARASFDSTSAERRLCALYGVATLEAFGAFSRAEISALGALVDYLDLTQRGKLPLLRPPVRENPGASVQIDAASRRNLELTEALSGGREGSLLAAIDRTVTAAGARLLERRISAPSRDLPAINARLAAVRYLVNQSAFRNSLRETLRRCPDIDRALSRLSLGRGGPRDLVAIRAGLDASRALSTRLDGAPPLLFDCGKALGENENLHGLLNRALLADPPILLRDGGFIAAEFDAELDETRALRDEGRGIIGRMQAEYAELAGISGLKIKHNNVLGYFIETTLAHGERLLAPPHKEAFIHRQTTASQMRFTTLALSGMETRILNAGNHAIELEKQHFEAFRALILESAGTIGATARALAEIDLTAGLADLAAAESWNEPVVADHRGFIVKGGRHPVVERALRRQGGGAFVANDCALTSGEAPAIWLLTGPNMAGKSTFLRQNALIALLAQSGSFVPASFAEIGLVSQIFSRVGAADDLARGRSTFMVEMVETAAILTQADDRALVILDEIGRGTATYDGLSIAWATLEHLHGVNRCRALFATHYHEMTALAGALSGVQNATVSVKEWDGDVIFLHEVKLGAADRSYGVQVARLAGLPQSVVDRAKVVLEALEAAERDGTPKRALVDDLPLFRAQVQTALPRPAKGSVVEDRLRAVLPDDLSPKDALQLVYELRGLLPGTPG